MPFSLGSSSFGLPKIQNKPSEVGITSDQHGNSAYLSSLVHGA